jgi:Antibiotic biosynthesis monooxygenase
LKHLQVATYKITSGTFAEVADKAKEGMLPRFEQQPGFIRYGLADVGNSTCLSISLWETREQADKATPVAADWMRENLKDRMEFKTDLVGDLAFFKGVKEAVAV